jgi:hypothetical protein
MKRILLAAIIIALAAASGFFAYRWRSAEARQQQTVAYIHGVMDSLVTTVKFFPPPPAYAGHDSLYWKWVAINAQVNLQRLANLARQQAQRRQNLLDEPYVEELKKQGLKDPAAELRASLMSRLDLIPYSAVLGGTMSFDEPSIVLLEPWFVFATFEDGHIEGDMLLSYEVTDGKIEWKRLWSALK